MYCQPSREHYLKQIRWTEFMSNTYDNRWIKNSIEWKKIQSISFCKVRQTLGAAIGYSSGKNNSSLNTPPVFRRIQSKINYHSYQWSNKAYSCWINPRVPKPISASQLPRFGSLKFWAPYIYSSICLNADWRGEIVRYQKCTRHIQLTTSELYPQHLLWEMASSDFLSIAILAWYATFESTSSAEQPFTERVTVPS